MAKKQIEETQATEEVVEVEEVQAPVAPADPTGMFAQQQAICFGIKSSL